MESRARTHALTAAVLVLPALGLFGTQLLGLESLFFRDTGLYFLPHKQLVASAIREGRLPQWNPFEYGGLPLLADPNFNVFHPLSLLTDFLPLPWGFSLFVFACALSAAFGARAAGRALGLSQEAALLCGFAYAWSGPSVSLLQSGQGVAGSFLPWLIAAAARLGTHSVRRSIVEIALASALVFLSGTPEIGACAFLLAALSSLAAPWPGLDGWRRVGKGALVFALGALLGALLAAIQLVPTAEFLASSSRAAGWDYASASAYSLRPGRLLGLLVPLFSGAPDAPGLSSWLLPPGESSYVQDVWAGLLVLTLVLVALGARKVSLRPALLLGTGLVLALAALGKFFPLHRALWETLPLMRAVRFPEKLIVPLSLPLALCAGLGWDALWERLSPAPLAGRRLLPLVALPLALAVWAATLPLWGRVWLAPLGPERTASLLATAIPSLALECLLLALLLASICFVFLGRLSLPAARAAVALLIAVELLVPSARLWSTIPARDLAPAPLALALHAQLPGPAPQRFSVQSLGVNDAQLTSLGDASWGRSRKLFWLRKNALFDSSAALSGLSADRGYSGLTPGALKALYSGGGRAALDLLSVRYGIEFGAGHSLYQRLGFVPVADPLARTLREYGVPEAVRVFENPSALPRLSLVDAVFIGPEASGLVPSCPGRAAIWLAPDQQALLPQGLSPIRACSDLAPLPTVEEAARHFAETGRYPPPALGIAAIDAYAPERVSASLEAQKPLLALLTDTWAPGWTATLDGVDVPILAADGALRAVAVPAGNHALVMTYRAPGLATGAWLSLSGVIALLALLALLPFERRKGA